MTKTPFYAPYFQELELSAALRLRASFGLALAIGPYQESGSAVGLLGPKSTIDDALSYRLTPLPKRSRAAALRSLLRCQCGRD